MPQSREEMLAKKRAWQNTWGLEHPEELKARLKAQYQKHRAKRLATEKAKRQANRDAMNAAARARQKEMLSNPESPRALRFRAYQNRMQRHYNQLFPGKDAARKRTYRLTEKAKLKARAYATDRRARKAQALSTLSVAQEQEIKAAKGYRCDYCGKKAKELTIDHITPLGPDGPDILWNATAACRSCNSRKGRKTNPKPVQPLLLTIAQPKKKKG